MEFTFLNVIALLVVLVVLLAAYLITNAKPKMHTCQKCSLEFEARNKRCPMCYTKIPEEIGVLQEGAGGAGAGE